MQTVVLVVGDFDLSIGAVVSLSSVVAAQMMVQFGVGTAWAVLIALAIGAAIGAINGLLDLLSERVGFRCDACDDDVPGGRGLAFAGATVHGRRILQGHASKLRSCRYPRL